MLGHSFSDFVGLEKNRTTRVKNGFDQDWIDSGFRLRILRLLIFAAFLFLIGNLVRTQLFAGQYYRFLSEGNRIKKIPIHALRGTVIDRNGTALTVNLPAFRLVDCEISNDPCKSSVVSKEQAISLEAKGLRENQTLEVDSIRSYPLGSFLASVVGYVSEITAEELKKIPSHAPGDKVGRGGIEEQYENILKGIDGAELVEVDAAGRKLRTIKTIESVPGKDVALSVDANLSKLLSEEISTRKGAAIVSNPTTGEILALVSSPSFDPNIFTDLSLSSDYREEKIRQIFADPNLVLFNRAISGTYPPGSTFKLITATAALESGAISANTQIEDVGVLVIGPYKFPNWKWLKSGKTDGLVNVVAAIRNSNDIFFYQAGGRTGIETLTKWAAKFGLGNRLGIDLPGEAKGSIKKDREWFLGDTYHTSIGQGDLLVTPLQVNFWTNTIANGGKLCQPILAAGKPNCLDLGIQRENAGLIQEGMKQACSEGGTGWPMFGFGKTPGLPAGRQVFCKTGTAEFGDPNDHTHAWFTMYFEKPAISLTILLEGAGEGSDVSAPIAREVLQKWLESN